MPLFAFAFDKFWKSEFAFDEWEFWPASSHHQKFYQWLLGNAVTISSECVGAYGSYEHLNYEHDWWPFIPRDGSLGHGTVFLLVSLQHLHWLCWKDSRKHFCSINFFSRLYALIMYHVLEAVLLIPENTGLWPANWPCPALGLQLTGNHYVGKLSATAQPTQPFILFGLINE